MLGRAPELLQGRVFRLGLDEDGTVRVGVLLSNSSRAGAHPVAGGRQGWGTTKLALVTGSVDSWLEQLAAQNAGQAQEARAEQHDAAGLRRGSCPLPLRVKDSEGIVPTESCGRQDGQLAPPPLPPQPYAAVFIPVNRIAAGNDRVLQVEPVGGAAGGGNVQPRHCDQIDEIVLLS